MQEYKTTDGVTIVAGLRVFTNDCVWGIVDRQQFIRGGRLDPGGDMFDGWFRVMLPEGGSNLYNGERMSTRDLDGKPEDESRFPKATAPTPPRASVQATAAIYTGDEPRFPEDSAAESGRPSE